MSVQVSSRLAWPVSVIEAIHDALGREPRSYLRQGIQRDAGTRLPREVLSMTMRREPVGIYPAKSAASVLGLAIDVKRDYGASGSSATPAATHTLPNGSSTCTNTCSSSPRHPARDGTRSPPGGHLVGPRQTR